MDQKAARDHETDSGQNKVRFGRLRAAGRRVLPLLAAAGFAFLGVYLYGILFPAPLPPSQAEIDASVNQILASVTPQPAYSTTVYQNILPSLVFIRVTGEDANEDEGYSIGSGVVVTDQGDILTAYHVVDNSFKIEVFFADGSQAAAELIAAEPENDIAMLRPDKLPEVVVPAVLGSSNGMRVGDQAFAVGNPLGFVASMSAGVISGFDRTLQINELGDLTLEGLIQFDTAVNPGSSGGPLLNRQGQVIGIVTGLVNASDEVYFSGIGFAVPIGTASAVGGSGPDY